jgi:hypothetical protein
VTLSPEKRREYDRRYRLRKKIAKYGPAAATIDMRGRHGNHARGAANGRYGRTDGGPVVHGYRRGHSHSRTYNAWCAMKARCQNPKNDRFARYGGRGIRVCRRWGKFVNFLADMGPAPSAHHWIGRIHNNRNYSPSNCRWETPRQQANQRSNNRIVTFGGRSATVAEWARRVGLSYSALQSRLDRGWPLAIALDPDAVRVVRTSKVIPKRPVRRLRCPWCHTRFSTTHVRKRFCSSACNKRSAGKASYWRHRERINLERRRLAARERRAAR